MAKTTTGKSAAAAAKDGGGKKAPAAKKKKKASAKGGSGAAGAVNGPPTTLLRLVAAAPAPAGQLVVLPALALRARVLGCGGPDGKLYARVGDDGDAEQGNDLMAPAAGAVPLPPGVELARRAERALEGAEARRAAEEVAEELAAVQNANLPLPPVLRARALAAARAALAEHAAPPPPSLADRAKGSSAPAKGGEKKTKTKTTSKKST